MMENKKTKVHEIHYSRYIASWNNKGLNVHSYEFEDWLRSEDLELTEQEIRDIYNMAICGKLELEKHAEEFHKNYKEVDE